MREEKLKFYDQLVAACSRFERKGKTMPYTSANGYMFSLFNKDSEIGFRLPKEAGKKFMEEHGTTIYKSYGAVMRDYVLIPESLHGNEELLVKTLNEAYDYVMSLPPKKTKK